MCFKLDRSENFPPLSTFSLSRSILASALLFVSLSLALSVELRVRYWFQVYSWRLVRFAGVKTSKGRGRVAAPPVRTFQILILKSELLSRKFKGAPCRHTRKNTWDENPMVKLRVLPSCSMRLCARVYLPLKLLLAFWIWRNGSCSAPRKSTVNKAVSNIFMEDIDSCSAYVMPFINFWLYLRFFYCYIRLYLDYFLGIGSYRLFFL